MKKSVKIYLVTVNDEPVYSSLSEDEARIKFIEEKNYTEAGFIKTKNSVSVRELKIKVD